MEIFDDTPIPHVIVTQLDGERYHVFGYACKKPCKYYKPGDEEFGQYCAHLAVPGGSMECGSAKARRCSLIRLMAMAQQEIEALKKIEKMEKAEGKNG